MFNLSASYQRKMHGDPGKTMAECSFKKNRGVRLTKPTPYSIYLVIF